MKTFTVMMRNAGAVFVALVCAAPLAAQEKGQVGLDLSFHGSPAIGVTWHLSKRLALRPSLGFTRSSMESEDILSWNGMSATVPDESERSSVRYGVATLFYLPAVAETSTYLGASYHRIGASSESDPTEVEIASGFLSRQPGNDIEESGNSAAAFLGLKRFIGKKVAVYGEAGLGFSWRTVESRRIIPAEWPDSGLPHTTRLERRDLGSFTGSIGAVFYFN
jgi:hypothetical protein